jgi:hypothetical protein
MARRGTESTGSSVTRTAGTSLSWVCDLDLQQQRRRCTDGMSVTQAALLSQQVASTAYCAAAAAMVTCFKHRDGATDVKLLTHSLRHGLAQFHE